MVSTLAQDAIDAIFPSFITPTTLIAVTIIKYKLCILWLLSLPCVGYCLYVGNCKH